MYTFSENYNWICDKAFLAHWYHIDQLDLESYDNVNSGSGAVPVVQSRTKEMTPLLD